MSSPFSLFSRGGSQIGRHLVEFMYMTVTIPWHIVVQIWILMFVVSKIVCFVYLHIKSLI